MVGAAAGAPAVTVTKALWFVLPLDEVATSVYDVLSAGDTLTEPEVGSVPLTPAIVTDVAPVVAHVRVELCPT